jgi:hypothetical protein
MILLWATESTIPQISLLVNRIFKKPYAVALDGDDPQPHVREHVAGGLGVERQPFLGKERQDGLEDGEGQAVAVGEPPDDRCADELGRCARA